MTLDTYNSSDVTIQEIKLDYAIQNFLERHSFESYNIRDLKIEENRDVDFIKINHISYDRNRDDTNLNLIDFQQILSAISSKTQKIVYIVEGTQSGIDLYLGTHKDSKDFLDNTFNGIYSGSETKKLHKPKFDNNSFSKAMLGIPSLKRDSDKKYNQSLEKILFPMQGKCFRIVIVAKSYDNTTIKEIISNYQNLGNELHRLVKQSKNIQDSQSNGVSFTQGLSVSDTKSESHSSSTGVSDKTLGSKVGSAATGTAGIVIGAMAAGPYGVAVGAAIALGGAIMFSKTKTETTSTSNTISRTNSTNESLSTNENTTKTLGITHDEINKSAEYCEKLIDKYIERFQKGLNHGMWNTSLYIQSDNETTLAELEHTLKSVYSGDETYFEAIRFGENLDQNQDIQIENLPMLYFDQSIQHPIHNSFAGFSSAINTEELSILSALPNSDIDGVSVSKISSFGLTQSKNIDK